MLVIIKQACQAHTDNPFCGHLVRASCAQSTRVYRVNPNDGKNENFVGTRGLCHGSGGWFGCDEHLSRKIVDLLVTLANLASAFEVLDSRGDIHGGVVSAPFNTR